MVTNDSHESSSELEAQLISGLSNLPSDFAFSPLDMGRLSIEHLIQTQSGGSNRFLKSTGRLHIVEGGSDAHQADLENISQLISSFQSLVTNIGGSLRGHKNLRGKMAHDVVQDTRLKLDANPAAGSVILILSPQRSPADELEIENSALFERKTEQLIDLVFPKLNLLFEEMVGLPEDPSQELDAEHSILSENLRSLGPRVASSLRHFSDVSSSSNFSVDISWAEPHKATIRTKILHPDAAGRASMLISNSATDEETVEIKGIMRTVSDIEALAITPFIDGSKKGKTIHIKGTELPAGALDDVNVGSRVAITALMTKTAESIDGRSSEKFTAKKIRLI